MPFQKNNPPPKNNYGWTPERRAEARGRALKHKPWQHSTGPKTEAGKARVAQNARKYSLKNAEEARLVKEMLDLNKAYIERFLVFNMLQYNVTRPYCARRTIGKNKLIKDVLKQGGYPPKIKNLQNKLINRAGQ